MVYVANVLEFKKNSPGLVHGLTVNIVSDIDGLGSDDGVASGRLGMFLFIRNFVSNPTVPRSELEEILAILRA